jgi:hypothetical protein
MWDSSCGKKRCCNYMIDLCQCFAFTHIYGFEVSQECALNEAAEMYTWNAVPTLTVD